MGGGAKPGKGSGKGKKRASGRKPDGERAPIEGDFSVEPGKAMVGPGRGGKRAGAGRKPFEATDHHREVVSQLAALGYTQEQIALFIISPEDGEPISVEVLTKNFRYELDTGALKANALVGGKLFEKAMSGDAASMFFWMKTRARWSEKHQVEVTTPKDQPFEIATVESARAKLARIMAQRAAAAAAEAVVESAIEDVPTSDAPASEPASEPPPAPDASAGYG